MVANAIRPARRDATSNTCSARGPSLTPSPLLLVLLGFLVATTGTLIGAGGGFVLVPALLTLFPSYRPPLISSVSLVVVLINAISGTIAYLRMRRIDMYVALTFATATIPGAIAGAYVVRFIDREGFERFFGLLLLAVSAVLLLRSPTLALTSEGAWMMSRELVDYRGVRHLYNIPMLRGLGISVIVGCLSSLFGIGGGIIHVPAMILLLQVPVPVATATSQFILAITSLAGAVTHAALGHLQGGGAMTLWLALGAVPGAQFGAALSRRLHARWIVRVLAAALMLTAVRLIA